MSTVSTGNREYDIQIDNAVAYGLVAGTRDPEPRDIETAKTVLPRLERVLADAHDHGVMDTVSCVHFALREWDTARKGWESAIAQLSEARLLSASDRAESEALYKRRLDAAKTNLGIATGRTVQPYLSLPLAFDPNQPEVP